MSQVRILPGPSSKKGKIMIDIHPASMLGLMFLLHFFADFNLQIGAGLDKFKQKKWWKDQIDKEKSVESMTRSLRMYRHDYLCGLVCHGLYWSLVVCLPLLLVGGCAYAANALIQGLIHASIDHEKANKFKMNLIEDQIIHAVQIIGIWGAWMLLR